MFIHKYMHNKNTQIVNEDWGYALAKVAVMAGSVALSGVIGGMIGNPLGGAVAGTTIGVAAHTALDSTLKSITLSNVKKVLADPKVKKFIIKECENVFKAAVKENKDFTIKLASGDYDPMKDLNTMKKFDDPNKRVGRCDRVFKNTYVMFTLDKYRLYIEGDSNTIKSISLTLTRTSKKNKFTSVIFKALPTPSTKDIKDYFAD